MGSLFNSPNIAAPNFQVNKKGLDMDRCDFSKRIGVWQAAADASFQRGNYLTIASTGYWNICTGADVRGVSLANKVAFGTSVRVDLPITMTGTAAQSLGRANVSAVAVRSATGMGGTQYTVTTDYTADATAGTVTRVALGSITDGQLVYVTFTYALVDADFKYDGRTWWNNALDEVSRNANRVEVATDWSMLFSIQYDTADVYALTGANSDLFCDAAGRANSTSANDRVGSVVQLPSVDDPYMGIFNNGNVV